LFSIKEEKFGDFFKSNPKNILQVHGNPLNCSDVTPYLWLLQNRSQFENRLKRAQCWDGTSLWSHWDTDSQQQINSSQTKSSLTSDSHSIFNFKFTLIFPLITFKQFF
jgi:hypothetical protein